MRTSVLNFISGEYPTKKLKRTGVKISLPVPELTPFHTEHAQNWDTGAIRSITPHIVIPGESLIPLHVPMHRLPPPLVPHIEFAGVLVFILHVYTSSSDRHRMVPFLIFFNNKKD